MTMSDPTCVALAHAGFCGAGGGAGAGAAVSPPVVGNAALGIGLLGETVGRAPVAGVGAGGGLGAGAGVRVGMSSTGVKVGLVGAGVGGVEGEPGVCGAGV